MIYLGTSDYEQFPTIINLIERLHATVPKEVQEIACVSFGVEFIVIVFHMLRNYNALFVCVEIKSDARAEKRGCGVLPEFEKIRSLY